MLCKLVRCPLNLGGTIIMNTWQQLITFQTTCDLALDLPLACCSIFGENTPARGVVKVD